MSWLMADQLIANALAFLVLIYVARSLGPQDYGIYAYVFSIALLLGSLTQLGLDGLVIRELLKNPHDQAEILGTTAALRLAVAAVMAAGIVGFGYAVEQHTYQEQQLFLAAAVTVFVGPASAVVACWFKAKLQAVYPSISNIIASAAAGAMKIGFLAGGLGVVWVGVGQALGVIVGAGVIVLLYARLGGPSYSEWRFSLSRARSLLGESWKLLVGSTFAMIYMQIDITMLRLMVNSEAAGEYAIAARVVMMTTLFAGALTTTLFPSLIRAHADDDTLRYHAMLRGTFGMMFVSSYVLVVGFVLLGPTILVVAFGAEYAASETALVLLSMVLPFAFARMVITRWIILERQGNYLIGSEVAGASVNVTLNFLLIPTYGGIGAAISTILSFVVTTILCLAFTARGRILLALMLSSMINPVSPALWMVRHGRST